MLAHPVSFTCYVARNTQFNFCNLLLKEVLLFGIEGRQTGLNSAHRYLKYGFFCQCDYQSHGEDSYLETMIKKVLAQRSPKPSRLGNKVDEQLRAMKAGDRYKHKIPLLSWRVGKSTVLKQIKARANPADARGDAPVCGQHSPQLHRGHSDYAFGGRRARDELDNTQLLEYVEDILSVDLADAHDELTPALGRRISAMWKDKGLQGVYDKREFFHLMDSTDYYLNEVERIAEPDFIPLRRT